MKPEISIIIPCYDCAGTLEEAVSSIYAQNPGTPFEVVMVDDASTDNTRKVMVELANRHKEIRCFYHEKNLGGGAARNTAVGNSLGRFIFCLDSDDMLGQSTLSKMLGFIKEKKCDAVGISRSVKFRGKDVNNVSYVTDFGYISEKIPIQGLLEQTKCSLFSTFLHTRESFYIAGGYPTDHGFDTQGFAFRFLANGLSAYTCPDTTYLHRVEYHQSYYDREAETGNISLNWYKVIEEFLYLFRDDVKDGFIGLDLNDPGNMPYGYICKFGNPFTEKIQSLLRPHSLEAYESELLKKDRLDKYESYWLGNRFFLKADYARSSGFYLDSISQGLRYPRVFYKAFSAMSLIDGKSFEHMSAEIEKMNAQLEISLLRRAKRSIKRIIRTIKR
jgi:glycosyltransferase involved in cell wall biosynthesis